MTVSKAERQRTSPRSAKKQQTAAKKKVASSKQAAAATKAAKPAKPATEPYIKPNDSDPSHLLASTERPAPTYATAVSDNPNTWNRTPKNDPTEDISSDEAKNY